MELTKKEAIELLKERYMTMSMCVDKDYCIKQNAAIDMAISALSEDSADIITQQKAEIEQLKAKNEILIKNADTAFQDGLNEAQDLYASQIRNEVRQEVIKEFAEKFKEKISQGVCCGRLSFVETKNELDNIVKEMAERTKSEDAGKRIYDDFMKSCKI